MSASTGRSGGCFCGAVRYRVAGVPVFVCICHCESCRKATGGAMVPWATFREADFSVTQGALALRESSRGVTRGHCSKCGTSITYQSSARPGEIDITLASLDIPSEFRPTAHIWTEDKLPWVIIADGLPQFERTVSAS